MPTPLEESSVRAECLVDGPDPDLVFELDRPSPRSEDGKRDTRSARDRPVPPPLDAERDANPPLPRPADRSPSLRLVNPPRFGLLFTLPLFELERVPLLFLGREDGPLRPWSSSSLRREKELRLVDIFECPPSPEDEGSGSDAAEGGWKPRPPELADRHAGPNRGGWDVSLLIVDVDGMCSL
jgi:hypothetical protein